jgi:hypothetical protein
VAEHQVVRDWFELHPENLAEDLTDLSFICHLPWQERGLLSFPIVGNWFLEKVSSFEPQTPNQKQALQMIQGLTLESRFNNHHWKPPYADAEGFNRKEDEFNAFMLTCPDELKGLEELTYKIMRDVQLASHYHEIKDNADSRTIDLGHGLLSPIHSFCLLTIFLRSVIDRPVSKSMGLTVMVIDDTQPEDWYKRLINVGFAEQEGRPGYFPDCESALEALKIAPFDVVLTDLELGKGKMSGLDFVPKAWQILREHGILVPKMSAFSYNDELLKEAEKRFGPSQYTYKYREPEQPMFLHNQVDRNNKINFTAYGFRDKVISNLPRQVK